MIEEIIQNLLDNLKKINLNYLKSIRTKAYIKEKYRKKDKIILMDKGLFKYIIHKFKSFIIIKSLKNEAKSNGQQNIKKISDDQKVIIYTAIIGKYDQIMEPIYVGKNCKYVLFTDNKDMKSDKWEIRDIPENIKKLNNNILINRYIKMHPKELFKDCDFSIYIDGNVKTIGDIRDIAGASLVDTGLAIHRHSTRKCIYKEVKTCILLHKGKFTQLLKQIKRYKKEKFPQNYGLLECNVIVADLNNNCSVKILSDWWNEFVSSESHRDQISLPYILWKNNILINDIGCLGNNIYLNENFIVVDHK